MSNPWHTDPVNTYSTLTLGIGIQTLVRSHIDSDDTFLTLVIDMDTLMMGTQTLGINVSTLTLAIGIDWNTDYGYWQKDPGDTYFDPSDIYCNPN